MPSITMGVTKFTCQPGETVLDVLSRVNIQIPNSCRQGVCQSCLMRSLDKSPPVSAQTGLKDTLQKQNYFLACICYPEQDMSIALPDQERVMIEASVVRKQFLSADIVRVVLQYEAEFNFFAGQFIKNALCVF